MTQEYPNPSEFRSDSPRCRGVVVGCAIAGIEALVVRFKANGKGTLNQSVLGKSAGARHRKADPKCHHGICPSAWCSFCVTLELKARGVATIYGHLTVGQLRARAKARLPMSVSILYRHIPIVGTGTYSRTKPARGRSDRNFGGGHQVVVWRAITDAAGNVTAYVISDPDFGSASRPVVPPYSIISRAAFERAFLALNFGVAQVTKRPPALHA